MARNEELIRELKATCWRIAKLTVGDGVRTRLDMDEAFIVVARTSRYVLIDNLGIIDAQSIGPQVCSFSNEESMLRL